MSRPTVSVVIPTYNSGRFVTHAIESVMAQSYDDWELIVVDDGSTDGTAARVQSYGDDVRYVEHPHRGPGAARNYGVSLARGEWLAFLDADDFWYAKKLELQLDLAKANPSLELITGNHHSIDDNGRLVRRAFDDHPMVDCESALAEEAGLVFGREQGPCYVRHRFGVLSTTLVRADLFRAAGGFNERLELAEDVHLMIRLVALCQSFGAVCQSVAAFRVRSGPASRQEDERQHEAMIDALADLVRFGYLPRPMARAVREQIAEEALALAYLLARQQKRLPATLAALRALVARPSRQNLRHLYAVNTLKDSKPDNVLDDLVDPVELFMFGAII